MPSFTALDVGTLGRAWRDRCQPQIGLALVAGLLLSLLIGGGLAVRQVSLDTLILWSKYQFALGANGIGLPEVRITWPGEGGETLTSVGELLQTPGLDAWAEPVSRHVGGSAAQALLAGLLAFAATLLWSAMKTAPERMAAVQPVPVEVVREPPLVEAEKPLPVALPPVPPKPVERPYLANQEKSPPSDNPQRATPREAPNPEAQPSRSLSPPPPAAPPPPPATAPAGKPSVSYEFYWGLTGLPFENVPDPKFYFPTPMHEEALHRLLYGIQTRKGALLLTGEIGCGKTLLSRELSLHLSGQEYDVAVIANPSFGTEDFLTEVLYQLGIEPTKTKVKLLHLLNERLLDNYKRGKQTVVVIDEAQTIQDNQIFEELRLLLNFQLNDRFLLTLVLMGQPELNDRLAALKQFAQRISIKYHLGFFSSQQTIEYIRFRLKAANCAKEIFTEDALELIFRQSGGIPRNINTLCDLSLLVGYMDRAACVDHKIAERAAADWGQLGLF